MVKIKSKMRKKMQGIGLLELMLSLAIIAILLVMATRYFLAANESQKINNAISQIHGIAGGAANYSLVHPGYDGMTIASLVAGNFIPASFGGSGTEKNGTGANPWGGNLSVAVVTTGGQPGFTVTLTNVPGGDTVDKTCKKLEKMVNGAVCSNGTVTVTF